MVQEIALAILNPQLDAEEVRVLLTRLLFQYEKLLRETQQLIKLSDRKVRDFHLLNQKLKRLSEDLDYQSRHDILTGLYNKGEITRILQEHLAQRNFVLLLFDVDFFKKINDVHGHIVGDKMLHFIAERVSGQIDSRHYVGRFGGEEFLLILNGVTSEEAVQVAESLREMVAQSALEIDGLSVKTTVSIGLTHCRQHEVFEAVYIRVDNLLYRAKHQGRNRVEYDINPD